MCGSVYTQPLSPEDRPHRSGQVRKLTADSRDSPASARAPKHADLAERTLDKLYYVVTTRCHVGCDFCYYATGVLQRIRYELRPRDALRLVQEAGACGVHTIAFTGGEPLLRPDIVDLVAAADLAGVQPILVSSGSGLTPDLANRLGRAGLVKFALSVHRGSREELRRVRAAVEVLAGAGIAVRCNFLLSRRNASFSDDVLRVIRDCPGVDGFFQPLSLPLGHPDRGCYCLGTAPIEEVKEVLARMTPWCEQFSLFEYREYLTDFYAAGLHTSLCRISQRALMVNADGCVCPCFYRTDLLLGRFECPESLTALMYRSRSEYHTIDAAPCRGEQCVVPYFFANVTARTAPGEAPECLPRLDPSGKGSL